MSRSVFVCELLKQLNSALIGGLDVVLKGRRPAHV